MYVLLYINCSGLSTANQYQVMMELQADCYSGVFTKHAYRMAVKYAPTCVYHHNGSSITDSRNAPTRKPKNDYSPRRNR